MLKYFRDLDESARNELIQHRKNELLKTRKSLLERFTLKDVNDIWYCKKEYINGYTIDDDFLIDVCENCLTPLSLVKVIYDKPANYGCRNVLYKCRCGKFCMGV